MKPVNFTATLAAATRAGAGLPSLVLTIRLLLIRSPCDLYVIEPVAGGFVHIRAAASTRDPQAARENELLYEGRLDLPVTIWCRIDDYPDGKQATFLLPEEY